jgi:uncharacterized protein (UPF0264 family)
VSVRDAGEALAALAGATIVDVKEPSRGPLGRPHVSAVVDVLRAVAGRAVVTLACGELADGPHIISRYVEDVLNALPEGTPGPVAVKAGPSRLGTMAWREHFHVLVETLPLSVEAVAVAYADSSAAACLTPDELLESAVTCGAQTFLVDTYSKAGSGLFGLVERATLRRWVNRAKMHGLQAALAGKLTESDAVAALGLGAALVGVRSAACDGGRLGRVDPARVRALGKLTMEWRIASMPPSPGALTP